MINRLFILLIGIIFIGCGHSTDKLNGVWVSSDLDKLQSVLVIENGLFSEHSWWTFHYKAKLNGDEIILNPINPMQGDEDEILLKYKYSKDTLIINNIQANTKYLYIRRSNHIISELIISSSKRKIILPKIDYCGVDYINNEHNIFIDKRNYIDSTVILDDREIKVWQIASARIHESRDGMEERIINLYIDKDVPYEYLKDVQFELRLSNNLRVRYVIDENKCTFSTDSTQLQLNYFKTNLPQFMGNIDDSLGIFLPPSPPPFSIEKENLFKVKVDSLNIFNLNGEIMSSEWFFHKFDSIISNNSNYVLVYDFFDNAKFSEYLNFRVNLHNRIYNKRNQYSYDNYGLSFDEMSLNNEDLAQDKLDEVKKRIPYRLTTIEDYEINQRLNKNAK
tara:strand:- start:2313 stop:3488 length:1176 start_codon:yes stop_codon:yes gene_type:complete